MDEILKQLDAGKFTFSDMGVGVIKLDSGLKIWANNSWKNYGFYPSLNTKFTLWEKWKMRKAIKNGLIIKALAELKEQKDV